mgnify:CR=1 FL=1
MDIGFEGDFFCLKKSINVNKHPEWMGEDSGNWVRVAPTIFDTVFANDIRLMQKLHGYLILIEEKKMPMLYIILKV